MLQFFRATSRSSIAVASKTVPAGVAKGVPPPSPPATSGKVSFFRLFRFADGIDKVLYAVAFLAAAANGVVFPSFTFIMGGLLDVRD